MDEFYCSNCEKPVKEEEKICPHCGADLTEMIEDVNDQNLVEIKTYLNFYEAETAQQFLLQCGIDSFISKDDAGGMYPHHFGGVNNFRLLVLESNAEEAVKILESSENKEISLNDESEEN